MGASIFLRDVVGEAEHGFLIGVGPLQRHVDHDAVLLPGDRDDIGMQGRLQLRQMLDEAADAALVLEQIPTPFAAGIAQLDLDAGIEERQLAQAPRQDLVLELHVGEDIGRRAETDTGAVLVGRFQLLQRVQRLTGSVFLLPVETIAPDVHPQMLGQGVDHRNTHAMQAAGYLVAVVVELSAGVQHGHDDLRGRNVFFLVDVRRNTASIVGNRDRTIIEDRHRDMVAIARQGLVDRVVHHLEDHVVQAGAIMHIADIHAGTLANRFETAQDGDLAGIVCGFAVVDVVAHMLADGSRDSGMDPRTRKRECHIIPAAGLHPVPRGTHAPVYR